MVRHVQVFLGRVARAFVRLTYNTRKGQNQEKKIYFSGTKSGIGTSFSHFKEKLLCEKGFLHTLCACQNFSPSSSQGEVRESWETISPKSPGRMITEFLDEHILLLIGKCVVCVCVRASVHVCSDTCMCFCIVRIFSKFSWNKHSPVMICCMVYVFVCAHVHARVCKKRVNVYVCFNIFGRIPNWWKHT
jgi:hypothetical protein